MNKALDLISKIICFVLCLLLFCVLFVNLILNLVPQIINTRNIEELVVRLDSETILGKETYSELYQRCIDQGLDAVTIEKVLSLDEIKPIYGKLMGHATEFVLYGKNNNSITTSDIIGTVEKYLDKIVLEFKVKLTAEQRNAILEQVKDETGVMSQNLTLEDVTSEEFTASDLKTIQFLFGGTLQFLLWVVIAIIVLVIALFRWSIYRFAMWTGITTTITGVCFVLISIGIANVIVMSNSFQVGNELLNFIQHNVLNPITKEGIIVTLIGAIQVGYYSLIKYQKGY